MAQYIDKDAIVAEIEKRISKYENCSIDNASINAKIIALLRLLIYINTLEAKEINSNDSFIEKACDYLSYHLDTSKIDVNYKFEFIEEFINYMKGE